MTDPNVPVNPPAPAPAAPYAAAPAAPATNVLAIIALIGAFVMAPVGIVCGHIALGQIKKSGEGGKALAQWGMILGYVFTALWLLIIVFSFLLPILLFGGMAASVGGF